MLLYVDLEITLSGCDTLGYCGGSPLTCWGIFITTHESVLNKHAYKSIYAFQETVSLRGVHGGIIRGAPWRCRTQGLVVTGENQAMDGKKLRWGTKVMSLQGDDAEDRKSQERRTRKGGDMYKTSGLWCRGQWVCQESVRNS